MRLPTQSQPVVRSLDDIDRLHPQPSVYPSMAAVAAAAGIGAGVGAGVVASIVSYELARRYGPDAVQHVQNALRAADRLLNQEGGVLESIGDVHPILDKIATPVAWGLHYGVKGMHEVLEVPQAILSMLPRLPIVSDIGDVLESVGRGVLRGASSLASGVFGTIGSLGSQALGTLGGAAQTVGGALGGAAQTAGGLIGGAARGVGGALGGVAHTVGGFLPRLPAW